MLYSEEPCGTDVERKYGVQVCIPLHAQRVHTNPADPYGPYVDIAPPPCPAPHPSPHLCNGLDVDVGVGECTHHRRGTALAVHHALYTIHNTSVGVTHVAVVPPPYSVPLHPSG